MIEYKKGLKLTPQNIKKYKLNIKMSIENFESYFANWQILIFLSYLSSLSYMVSTWLVRINWVSKGFANSARLVSLVMTTLAITLIIFNHAHQLVTLLSGTEPHSASIALWAFLCLWLSIVSWVNKGPCNMVLGCTLLMVPLYVFLLFFVQGCGLFKLAACVAYVHIYCFALLVVAFWGDDYFVTLQGFAKRISAQNPTYRQLLHSVRTYDDKPSLVLNVTCGLIFSLLNFHQLYQTGNSLGAYIVLLVVASSIVFYTILGFELISYSHKVPYHYNFVIQMYMNLYHSFKRVWHQTKLNQLPVVEIPSFLTVFILALVNTPTAYCVENGSFDFSPGSRGLSSYDSDQPASAGSTRPVDEGISEKIVQGLKTMTKPLGPSAKLAVEGAVPESR